MRWRSASLTAFSALLLAACGGGSDNTFTQRTVTQRTVTQQTGPTIDRKVADRLAARSDEIAVRLDAGDACGAAAEATRLRNELTAAINTQAIPAAYLEDLSGSVNELQAQIQCVPPPRRDKDDNGKHKGKKKRDEDDEH
jgi:hypothetical protein